MYNRYQNNPFVVLSDISIAVILFLLFYATTMILLLEAREKKLETLTKREHEQLLEIERIDAERTFIAGAMKQAGSPTATYCQNGVLSVESEGKEQQVFLFSDVLFETGRWQETSFGRKMIDAFGESLSRALRAYLQAHPGMSYPTIAIEGHTDTAVADNWTLSVERALRVVKILTYQGSLRTEYLSAVGYSCHRPYIGPPHDNTSNGRNRRIEVRLVFSSAPEQTRESLTQKWVPDSPWQCDCDKRDVR